MLPKKIVAIGASDFFGMGDPEEGGFIGRFKRWHEMQDIHNFVYNLGIRGETTTQILQRLIPEAIPRKPQLLILTAGSNDIRRKGSKDAPLTTSIERFKKNILELIKQGRSLADVVFVSTYPFDETKTTPFSYWNKNNYYFLTDIIAYEKEVRDICTNENVPFLDIFNKWIDKEYLIWLHEDGQHANPIGHKIIFEDLKNYLEILYS